MSDFKTLTLDGESFYLKPWENQRGTTYGPPDRDEYEITLVNLSAEQMNIAKSLGRNPSVAGPTSSKGKAGITEYYKITSQYKIDLADAGANKIENTPFIPNGSKIRVYVEVRPIKEEYQKGNTHKFLARGVQILEMADAPDDDWQPDNAASVFAAVEGGYIAEAVETSTAFETALPDDGLPF
jgi:hypothetical protein